uniref:Uncharacterized protein n=1 Tax=Arundo donax TaxID=35708 RepID=A0A0A8YQU0_ARUDO
MPVWQRRRACSCMHGCRRRGAGAWRTWRFSSLTDDMDVLAVHSTGQGCCRGKDAM